MLTTSLLLLRKPPQRSELKGGVRRCRDVLARRVLDSIGADGAIVGPCDGRAFESAIALCVLQRLDLCPDAQGRLVTFLRGQRADGPDDVFHRALIAGALGESLHLSPARIVDDYLGDFEHFSSGRKRVLFEIVLAAVLGVPAEIELEPRDFIAGPGQHQWIVVLMRALEVLYFCGRGQPERIAEDALDAVMTSARPTPGGVWQQYVLGHLAALLALTALTGYREHARRYAANLPNLQCANGGFSFITRMEVFATATAGLGLVGAGIEPERLHPVGDFLTAQQRDVGGWGYARGVEQTDVDDTAYCIEFLRALAPDRYAAAIDRGERHLLALQNADGGFPTFVRGGASEIAMTAAVLNALAPSSHRHPDVFRRGLRYIFDNHRPDGTFERSWSGAHTNAIFRAVLAAQTAADPMTRTLRGRADGRTLSYLRSAQNADGGWGHVIGDDSDALSSAYAIIALSHLDADDAYLRGVDYLVDQQRVDGGYRARPDGFGPRPILYDVPTLPDHFALISLNHVISTHPRQDAS